MKSLLPIIIIISATFIACSSTESVTVKNENLSIDPPESFDPDWYLTNKNQSIQSLPDSIAIKSVTIAYSMDSTKAFILAKEKAMNELFQMADNRAEIWKEKSAKDWKVSSIIELRRVVREYVMEEGNIEHTLVKKASERDGYYAWASAKLDHSSFLRELGLKFP